MSDETVYNLLRGTSAQAQTSTEHVAFKFALTKALEVGKTYTFSVDVDELSNSVTDSPYIGPNDGNGHVRYCTLYGTGHKVATFTVGNLKYDESVYDFASFAIYNTPGLPETWSATNRLVIRNAMLVEGDTPAAWAPAEGEELAGGGAQMSANLLDGIKPTPMGGTTESSGVWHNAGRTGTDGHSDWLVWDLAGQSALATNQTYHVGLSTRGASANSASLHATIGYKDAAGNVNWATSDPLPIGTSWGRAEATIVVPSGMTPFAFYVAAYGECPETWMTSPVLSYGSPVPLASSAHTPYATQDHVMVTYATKASLKVTDDSVKAEVSARAQTDQNVSDLSSRLTQTANSLTSEISDRRTAITTVTGLANAAQSTADAAKSSASNAVSTANSASSSAANAVETANAASSAASAASTAAGKASTDAAAAVKTANSASSTASGAVTTANEAAATANAASDTATAAQTMATENRSSIKQLSNSITSEVNARVKTDGAVSELSSKMEQTVNGINVSLDKLAATEKQIHSWFDFGTDSSGNPKLAMGSSSSPIIGEYSNTGTTYKDRSGATLLALDAANSTTGADHVVSNDVTVGKWKWVPTMNGTHLTLMWIGG